MNAQPASKQSKANRWPRRIQVGRVSVTVYRRRTPVGNDAFMVANYANGKRRFDSYPTEPDALEAANRLARQLSEREVLAAELTNEQASEYTAATQALAPFKLSLSATVGTLTECLKLVGDLPSLHEAAKLFAARHKRITRKPVAEVVAELLAVKEARGASNRYLQDLRFRLGGFAETFRKDACNVTTAEIQTWLDGQKLSPQSVANYRRVVGLLFEFAVARGYAGDNPILGVEKVKVRGGDVQIFTPAEVARLLAAASVDFLPCLAIGAFAGLRSAEIERLDWSNIDLVSRNITVGADRSKTATRRVVPICGALAAWLAQYGERQGPVWAGGHDAYYEAQKATAAATAIEADAEKGIKPQKAVQWKANALRHSYASYRFALTGDAGRVAGECGNSAAVIHRHYRELVKPADAERWFAVAPPTIANVVIPFNGKDATA